MNKSLKESSNRKYIKKKFIFQTHDKKTMLWYTTFSTPEIVKYSLKL